MYVRVTTVVELNQNHSKSGNPRSKVIWFRLGSEQHNGQNLIPIKKALSL